MEENKEEKAKEEQDKENKEEPSKEQLSQEMLKSIEEMITKKMIALSEELDGKLEVLIENKNKTANEEKTTEKAKLDIFK